MSPDPHDEMPTAARTPLAALPGRPHAVVTGGGSGIGAAVAAALHAAGARLTLMGRTEGRLEAQAERLPGSLAVPVDVTREDEVLAAFAAARAGLGPVAILVNGAGAVESAPFARSGLDLFGRMLDVNVLGAVACAHAALPDMQRAGWGRIVNIASTAGLKGYPYVSAYCTAKHALVGLTRALALELAASGAGVEITVNAVCPGYTRTGLLEDAIGAVAERSGRGRAQVLERFTALNPQRRLVEPDEVADAVVWLCRPESRSLTGQSVAVAGGEVMR